MDQFHELFTQNGFTDIRRYFAAYGTEYVTGLRDGVSYTVSLNGGYIFSVNNCFQIVSSNQEAVLSVVKDVIDGKPHEPSEYTKMVQRVALKE